MLDKKVNKMSRFLRSIDDKLQKHIGVIADNGSCKIYKSLIDMPESERLEYVLNAVSECDDVVISPEQFAQARAAVKSVILQQMSGRHL